MHHVGYLYEDTIICLQLCFHDESVVTLSVKKPGYL
jgi:hypothetical protein